MDLNFYKLPLSGEQVQSILSGAVVSNELQTLSEAEKAQARENIGASPAGSGIRVMAHFDSIAELEAAITNPSPGDAYSVGALVPYNLYIYDILRADWVDYGPIRSTDVSARFVQDVLVSVSDWEEDRDVFADYIYKAAIPVDGVTANDLPIVVFSPADAISGNYCPIAYTFDGYIEIWAREIPREAITIPAITCIAEGNA